MKKKLPGFICLLLLAGAAEAQVLFGTTSGGGKEGGGTINQYIPANNSFTIVKSFENLASRPYYTNLIQANNGRLYGMTSEGGSNEKGIIFSLDPASGKYIKLKDFDDVDGAPFGSLLQALNGKLYGMTAGGSNNAGSIFSFNPLSGTYTKLKDFDYANGAYPNGSLIQASNGKIYGMTTSGGSNDVGVIFSFDPASLAYKKLLDFDGVNGGEPQGSFIQAGNGKLYGMTLNGGSKRMGNIFSFDPASSTYAKVKDFDGATGSYPRGNLVQATNGKLYGMTSSGGSNGEGVIFSVDPSSNTYVKLRNFSTAGGRPYGSLIQAGDGKLYGLATYGAEFGLFFSFDPLSSTYKKIKDFDNVNGSYPYGSLVQATNGKLYGMTTYGGIDQAGVIFSFDPSSSTYKKLRDISSNEKGSYVSGGLVRATDKKLYGVTAGGGINNMGIIFSFDPSSSKFARLKDFDSANGAYPYEGLIQATNGRLYGITNSGGSKNSGVIFSFDPVSSIYTKVKDFDSTNGRNAYGRLIQATNGKLYGVTANGGSKDAGVIFSFDPFSFKYTKLKDLDSAGGKNPYGSLLQATNGKLYGLTSTGGSSDGGVIFSFDPASSKYTRLKNFNYADGAYPYGSLVQAKDGKLYGLTSQGGVIEDEYSYGVIFSFDPSAGKYKKLWDFNYVNGFGPAGSLTQAGNGKLYGVTNYGGIGGPGEDGNGTFFSIDPSSSAFNKLQDFVGINGIYPNSPLIEVGDCVAGVIYYRDNDGDGYGNPSDTISGCPLPVGYVSNNSDCNDFDPAIYPGAAEVCNGVDDDCDGQIDSWKLEGEEAVLSGAIISSAVPGFTGAGYADYQNATGDYVEWTVKAAAAGPFLLQFRYGNGDTKSRFLRLEINGIIIAESLAFTSTGSYAIWSQLSVSVNLLTGLNKIRLITVGSQGPNVDNLTVKIIGCQQILEAELALLNGAAVASNQPGYTGTGYADYKNGSGNYIEWTVNNLPAGNYELGFRYANGDTLNRPLKLEVNGAVINSSLAFSPTGGWASWKFSPALAGLLAGTNKVRLTTIGAQGPNVDNLTLEILACASGTLEAEMAVLNGACIAFNQPGYTGTGYADYTSGSGHYIEWVLNNSTAAPFSLKFRYANGGLTDRPLKLEVNEIVVANLPFSPTGSWSTWSVSSINAGFISGVNKIRLTTTGSQGPNVDNFAFGCSMAIQPAQVGTVLKNTSLTTSFRVLRAYVRPNPVAGSTAKLFISSPSRLSINLQLFDMSGRNCKSLKLLLKGSQIFNLPVNDLLPGAYTIILKQGALSTHVRLVVGTK